MTMRTVERLVRAMEVSEGAGVTVHRTIGTPALRHLDPFLMLDHFGSDDPGQYIAGFPAHPHRGFITLTYMLDGHMRHEDSMGNRGDLGPGGAQWMKAGSGVIHSEMPQQTDGLMRGFQLWINLPAREKMSDPAYQEFAAEAIPVVSGNSATTRILCGGLNGVEGPIRDSSTGVSYVDVELAPRQVFTQSLPTAHAAFVNVFEGSARIGETQLPKHHLAVLGKGDEVALTAGADGARFILVAGAPIREPIVQHGPFVMNSREEIEQAMRDYRDGRLVKKRAAVESA
ncbi:MAG: pirin family protein [Proteobacteria bacterium]|nr:MAG: pirin family protein [Pseudomonadota bacterium]